jgi:hypothetical protein
MASERVSETIHTSALSGSTVGRSEVRIRKAVFARSSATRDGMGDLP